MGLVRHTCSEARDVPGSVADVREEVRFEQGRATCPSLSPITGTLRTQTKDLFQERKRIDHRTQTDDGTVAFLQMFMSTSFRNGKQREVTKAPATAASEAVALLPERVNSNRNTEYKTPNVEH